MTDYKNILARMKEAKKKSHNEFGVLVEQYDYQFYKGVMYFYCENYPSARKNFNRALSLLQKQVDCSKELSLNDE